MKCNIFSSNIWLQSLFQVIGGTVIVIMLPLVALTTQSASYVFTNFEVAPGTTGISSKPYAVILSFLVSQYSLYGYDAAAHLTEETRGADKNGPIAILSSIGIISIFGWAYILALTFSIQVFVMMTNFSLWFWPLLSKQVIRHYCKIQNSGCNELFQFLYFFYSFFWP